MRFIAVVALLALCVVGVSAVSRADGDKSQGQVTPAAQTETALPNGLYKPIVMNPLDSPHVQQGLEKFSNILAKEPEAARNIEGDDEEEEGNEDTKLLGPDKCDDINSKDKKCGDAKDDKAGKDGEKGKDDKAGAGKDGDTAKHIAELEKMIKDAMELSKSIPDKVKELEALKKKQSEQSEAGAKAEAEDTLKKHGDLLSELGGHIETMESKLKELKSKKKELESNDASLKKELDGEKKEGGEEDAKDAAEFLELPSN